MAASSGDDIPTQLAALLGYTIKRIRITDEVPPRISVIDLAAAITRKDANQAAEQVAYVRKRHPEVTDIFGDFKFRGQGQKKTAVAELRGAVELTFLLPGRHATRVRRQAAELFCRHMGGDLALVDEVCRMRGLQDQLAFQAPEDLRRLFGSVVEASTVGSELAQIFATMNERMTNQEQTLSAQGQLLARIHESLEQDRQRVNLNVRAPKRAAPHQPQVARDIAGARPFPLARFLDAKEREDPSWKCARRSFAPAFSMQVQILKKKKLREEGKAAVYIEQNHRPQILYTEEDRQLMEEAWQLTRAHREDLAGRPGNPQEEALVVHNRPTVMDMLRGRE